MQRLCEQTCHEVSRAALRGRLQTLAVQNCSTHNFVASIVTCDTRTCTVQLCGDLTEMNRTIKSVYLCFGRRPISVHLSTFATRMYHVDPAIFTSNSSEQNSSHTFVQFRGLVSVTLSVVSVTVLVLLTTPVRIVYSRFTMIISHHRHIGNIRRA